MTRFMLKISADLQDFEVVSGPGRVLGVTSGDPAAHDAQQGTSCTTYAVR